MIQGETTHSEENVKAGKRCGGNVKFTFFPISSTLKTCRALTLQQCKPPNMSRHVNFAWECQINVFQCKRDLYMVKNVKDLKARTFTARVPTAVFQSLWFSIQRDLCGAWPFICLTTITIIIASCYELIFKSGGNSWLKCTKMCASSLLFLLDSAGVGK